MSPTVAPNAPPTSVLADVAWMRATRKPAGGGWAPRPPMDRGIDRRRTREQSTRASLAVRDPGPLESLSQGRDARYLDRGAIEIAEARSRYDRALEAQALRLSKARREPLHASQLAAQTQLAGEDRSRVGRAIAQRRSDRHGDGEI